MSALLTAHWNTVTGALWVKCTSSGDVIADVNGVVDELGAYAALTSAGFSRRANWLIVPGRRTFAVSMSLARPDRHMPIRHMNYCKGFRS